MVMGVLRVLTHFVASLVLAPITLVYAQTQSHFVLTELPGNPATQVL